MARSLQSSAAGALFGLALLSALRFAGAIRDIAPATGSEVVATAGHAMHKLANVAATIRVADPETKGDAIRSAGRDILDDAQEARVVGGVTNGSYVSPHRSLAAGALGSGFWSVKKTDFVDAQGNRVWFSGVIWSGFETPDGTVHGLWGRSLASHLDQMKSLGFNMMRLPFAGDTLLPSTHPTNINYNLNPDLQNLNSLQVMDKVIAGCKARGIKVILDYHRIHLTISNEKGLWYDDSTPESVWINNWASLAQRYKGEDTIIGADLFNEVHPCSAPCPSKAPFWVRNAGVDEKYNFRSATKRVIEAVHAIEPNWIMFLEGLYNNYWWGGNCAQMLKAPIVYPQGKIAYSAHEYGPYVFQQPWFFRHGPKGFPNNLKPLFKRRWGIIKENGFGAMWVGEFGSFYPQSGSQLDTIERKAFDLLIEYIGQIQASWTIAFWGPDSKDTGGILQGDWNTPDPTKLQLLQPIMHPGFRLA